MKRARRSGLTILELLVALTVIAILLAILVPAVLQVRETSRRTQCTANLANLGRALHAYETVQGKYPSAHKAGARRDLGENRHFSPHVWLLPHLEQDALYDQLLAIHVPSGVDLGENGWRDPDLQALAFAPVPVFRCPSDAGDSGNNYRVCLGTGPYQHDDPHYPREAIGAFISLTEYTSGRFRDGMSQTVAMSEKVKSDSHITEYSRREDFWFTGLSNISNGVPPPDDMVDVCRSLTGPPPDYYPFVGVTWMSASYAQTFYNHAVTPNADIPDCSMHEWNHMQTPAGPGSYKASSRHPGGVNVLFMDASVQFVGDSIDLGVWRALATREGQEIVSRPGR